MDVDMNKIPEPFREFLESEGVSAGKEIFAASIDEPATKASPQNTRASNDMQDMLFLAAILLLTDE